MPVKILNMGLQLSDNRGLGDNLLRITDFWTKNDSRREIGLINFLANPFFLPSSMKGSSFGTKGCLSIASIRTHHCKMFHVIWNICQYKEHAHFLEDNKKSRRKKNHYVHTERHWVISFLQNSAKKCINWKYLALYKC